MRRPFQTALFVMCLGTMAAAPAAAQLGDPLNLAAGGVVLPLFNDTAAGFVSVFEIVSPYVVASTPTNPPTVPLNRMETVFFTATCDRDKSFPINQTHKQATAFIGTASPFLFNANGLLTIRGLGGLLDFPIHSRTHWIDIVTGRLREIEPITVDTFSHLTALGPPLVWNPLRSAATFVTPQDTVSVQASIILICPRATISAVYPSPPFPALINRDGSQGFPPAFVATGKASTVLKGRIYDDNETLALDFQTDCDCLTTKKVTAISSIYASAPTNLGASTVPVWYTEIESQTVNPGLGASPQEFSFSGYWNLDVAGSPATLFHRMSAAAADDLSPGSSAVNFR